MKWCSVFFIGVLVLLAFFAPWLFPYNFQELHLAERFTPPGLLHIFGLDEQGQDLFIKIIYGSRLSLFITFSVVFLSLVFGLFLGTLAGLAGGAAENLIMAFADLVLAFPKFLLALAFLALAGPSFWNLIFVLTFSTWAGFARLIRGEVKRLKEKEFVLSARSYGAGWGICVLRHIWPHLLPVTAVHSLFQAGAVLIAESGLNFLGVGVALDVPSWGGLINSGRRFMLEGPHLIIFPCLIFLLFLLSLNILADFLREKLTPQEQSNHSIPIRFKN